MRWSRSGGEACDAQRTCCSCAHARLRERQSRYVRVRSRVAIRLELRRVPERERSRGDGLARPARRRRSRRVSNSLCVSLSLRILGFSSHLLKILNASSLRLSSSLPLVIGNIQGPGLPGLIYTPPSPAPAGHAARGGRRWPRKGSDSAGGSESILNSSRAPPSTTPTAGAPA